LPTDDLLLVSALFMTRYPALPAHFYQENRKHFSAQMQENHLAVFFSNDVLPTNADGNLIFRQNNDLIYLSGIDQMETILIVFPDAHEDRNKEILFIRETNDTVVTWEGYQYTKEQARELSGIKTILYTHQYETEIFKLMCECKGLYLNSNEHPRAIIDIETREIREGLKLKQKFPFHAVLRAAPIMQALRVIKRKEELILLNKAISITHNALLRVLKTIKPGVIEYQLEAELAHEMLSSGCKINFGYHPIFASGADSCILHYNDNNKPMLDGGIILMDFGVDYGNYQSDLTRVAPINGKFTPRQKEVYDAVLYIQQHATSKLRTGYNWIDYQKEIEVLTEEMLIKIGVLDASAVKNQNPEAPLYKKYFMHGVSHYLGMDVHDVGSKYTPFQAGMVYTVEPGIYIREEGIGIRLENNVLLTEGEPINLMSAFPITTEEIEAAMA
jgi:Xaa-Pro aminopeptidase